MLELPQRADQHPYLITGIPTLHFVCLFPVWYTTQLDAEQHSPPEMTDACS